ncbi:MAG: hypothetical protein M1819_002073 [Sarea resinae]|nr:MAG: hypothetical protein M1819_002073 [Sarea resinae]
MPPYLRRKFQEMLTVFWVQRIPIIQHTSPAQLAATAILQAIGALESQTDTDFMVVDFCSGGGGPTPTIERMVNLERKSQGQKPIIFQLTDLKPNVGAWKTLAKQSPYLEYVSESVDATNPPHSVVHGITYDEELSSSTRPKRVFRLYNLAFHHFDDALARKVLQSAMSTSDGFAIVEMQDRHLSSFGVFFFYFPTFFLLIALFQPIDLGLFFFTYIIPILPFALTFDGIVSALRTRTFEEFLALAPGKATPVQGPEGGRRTAAIEEAGWEFEMDKVMHSWPFGYMNWIVGKKKAAGAKKAL